MATTKEIFNRTDLSMEQVNVLPVLGVTISKWRRRGISLREHPSDPARLISVGVGENVIVIADEARSDWATALDYAAHGKVYIS